MKRGLRQEERKTEEVQKTTHSYEPGHPDPILGVLSLPFVKHYSLPLISSLFPFY